MATLSMDLLDVLASTLEGAGYRQFPDFAGGAHWRLSREIRARLLRDVGRAEDDGSPCIEERLFGYPIHWVDEPDELAFVPYRPDEPVDDCCGD